MAALESIRHIVVLMLENRSFDCMLGGLAGYDGLSGLESNPLTPDPPGMPQPIGVWADPSMGAGMMRIPDPDPGETFEDCMTPQIFGLNGATTVTPPPMSGFVDNYVRQKKGDRPYEPRAVMHYFCRSQLPVMSMLADSFGVCDRWHASAPCQTWPNRFFVHTGTAGGWVNNSPPHFPYRMPTIFRRLEQRGCRTRIYYHDVPQTMTLAELWSGAAQRFHEIDDFFQDAEAGDLPEYSFIEPRYFTNVLLGHMPNDQHPPHDVVYGEQLIARVYNALRTSPCWRQTLFVITYDEHGGCYDHVPPPAAASPDGHWPDGFAFDRFGVRVPALIISPYVAAGSVLRPADGVAFDHTSIIRTLRDRFDPGGPPLTARDAAAPSLAAALTLAEPRNDGPEAITVPDYTPTSDELADAAGMPPNHLQDSLCSTAAYLPRAFENIGQHLTTLAGGLPPALPSYAASGDAGRFAIDAFRRLL